MATSSFTKIRRLSSILPTQSRIIVAITRSSSSLKLPVSALEPSTSQNAVLEHRFGDLEDALARRGNPSRVWAYYINVLDLLGFEKLPLELHQDVLRKCTPTSAQLRVSAARRLIAGNRPTNPHIHEGRFQTIIRNIRSLGNQPTLDDYHFILDQFAAVGHHTGALQVYKELVHQGIKPEAKTIGLCFQAIAHRLSLPVYVKKRPQLLDQTRRMLGDLIEDMQKYQLSLTPANLDLTIRILKDSLDKQGFEMLLKLGYGIDLAHLDRPPLQAIGLPSTGSKIVDSITRIQPFSTDALNTVIDMLGRLGDISKMVEAFEVLTQPLPPQAAQHFSASFDDEDDFGYSDSSSQQSALPYASPNTTTYNLLLKYMSRKGFMNFARHYLMQAMELEHKTDRALRGELMRKPVDEVLAPHFALNRNAILSIFGRANRDKDIGTLQFLKRKLPKIIRRKQYSLTHFSEYWENLQAIRDRDATATIESRENAANTLEIETVSDSASTNTPSAPLSEATTTATASAFRRASPLDSGKLPPVIKRQRMPKKLDFPEFDVDLDVETFPEIPPKLLDLPLHIRILQRDLDEIKSFSTRLEFVLGRSIQRVKERLGRRVWADKNVYLRHEEGRVPISRNTWPSIVAFQPRIIRPPYTPNIKPKARHRQRRTASSPKEAGEDGATTLRTANPIPYPNEQS